MNAIHKRFLLFLIGCMGTRFLLVFLAATVPLFWLKVMAVFAAIVATGFATIFVTGARKTGLETGGERIWWNALRPLHALLYAAFAYFAWNGRQGVAWKFLLADVVIGLVSFLAFHWGVARFAFPHDASG